MNFLIFGLGNIGDEYAKTRHNVGFMILDAYAKASNIVFKQERYGFVAQRRLKGNNITLVKPTTYMNLSGKSVRYWIQKKKTLIENILVIADDINLPMGEIRIKPKGGDGGHNGLVNIIELIGTQQFARMRYGVGNNFSKGRQVDYVLGEFESEEIEIFEKQIELFPKIINSFATVGLQRTMNLYNGRKS